MELTVSNVVLMVVLAFAAGMLIGAILVRG